jgi:hypothetical protein
VDEEEKIASLAALASLGTDEAVQYLSGFLRNMNARLQSGVLNAADERLTRVIIPALGATGNKNAVSALSSVLSVDWTEYVKRLARQNLAKVQ